jgi:hypothetical protein
MDCLKNRLFGVHFFRGFPWPTFSTAGHFIFGGEMIWFGWFTTETKTNREVVGHLVLSKENPKPLCGVIPPKKRTNRFQRMGPSPSFNFGDFCQHCIALSKL